jgi:hypothetical protein
MHNAPRLFGPDDLEVLVDEDVVGTVDADGVYFVLTSAQMALAELDRIRPTLGLRSFLGVVAEVGGLAQMVGEAV